MAQLSQVPAARDEVRSYDAKAVEVASDGGVGLKGGSRGDRLHLRLPHRRHRQELGSRRVEPNIAALPPPVVEQPLPSGRHFQLTSRSQKPNALLHDSDLGRFRLTTDSVLATFTRRPDMQAILGQLPPAGIDALNTITYTIGGMVLWPGNQIDGKWTINQARGCTSRIADRFDLTVECVAATTRATSGTR
jgi:hypothetical protein